MYKIDLDYMEWARNVKPQLPSFISDRVTLPSQTIPGQQESPIDEAVLDCCQERLNDHDRALVRYCKFYMALMANEILKETPMTDICQAFGKCSRGIV